MIKNNPCPLSFIATLTRYTDKLIENLENQHKTLLLAAIKSKACNAMRHDF